MFGSRLTGARKATAAARRSLLLLAALSLLSSPLLAQSAGDADPMQPLERLVGGAWYLGEDSYQTFRWGLGRLSMVAEMFVVTPAGPQAVSEMMFAYHPGERVVKGWGVARQMGIDFFEYDITVDGETLVFDLKAFGPAAEEGPLRETWTFTDADHYEWSLLSGAGDGSWERTMSGTFERRQTP